MELFFRKEFRPHRTPFEREPAEIGRLQRMAFRTGRGPDPALRAAGEQMRDRNQPTGVVKRSGAKVHGLRPSLPLAVNPGATLAAEP